jgi:hypothetical protein
MTALSIEALRARATANGSGCNVDVASAWSLRWHDPFWIAAWERWRAAQAAWGRVWPNLDWNQYGDVYQPSPGKIVDLTLRAIAQEYLDARTAYKATFDLYPGDGEC